MVPTNIPDKDRDGIIDATDDPETNEILSETHYYPFGMNMEGPWMQNAGRENPYLYNGKELNEEFGLNWLSYGAREYDPAIGRWMAVDILAEKYYSMSPYNYVANNPLIYVDPFGMDLYLANNGNLSQAIADIMDLVNSAKFKGSVSFNFTKTENGTKVDADFGDLSNETIQNDSGLSVLNDLTSAKENYLYEVGESFSGIHRETGEETKKHNLATEKYSGSFVGNLSITDRGDFDPSGALPKEVYDQYNALPKNSFFSGHVIISPEIGPMKMRMSGNKEKELPRSLLALHELRESYNRTSKEQVYVEAHAYALRAEKSFYLYPSGGYKIRPAWLKSRYRGGANKNK